MNEQMNYWVTPDVLNRERISEEMLNVKRERAEVIINTVCQQFDVNRFDLASRSREHQYTEPRNILFFILHRVLKLSCAEVGKMFNRTHATVLSGANRIAGFVEFSKEYERQISEIINK